jgi:valyl-tRNA synthetase
MKQFPKTWKPENYENPLYAEWEKAGYFKPEVNPDGEPYTIIMPPPNSNGSLHLGHAVFITLEDIMTRFARLNGKAALWLPGADHAGFETQVVYEKKLEKEGKSRFGMDRKELYDGMWAFTQENKAKMEDQLRKLGASCDWSREKFTLDEDIVKTVYSTFKKLYDDGLVYRDYKPVNWCTKHQTSLSDLEVKYEEQTDPLYYIKYGEIEIATTRPETMLADIAIAVHPLDKRYNKLIGKEVALPLTGRKIIIISDDSVDIKFGTGAVKITPAHSAVDFDIAKKHPTLSSLETIKVITEDGRMYPDPAAKINNTVLNEIMEDHPGGGQRGKKIIEARKAIVALLSEAGLIIKIQNVPHSIGHCYKCNTIIEPVLKDQWFVAVNKEGEKTKKTLAKDALEAVKKGEIKFVSKQFEKVFNHWLNNIRDWNISRQIVWGIQIPAWYCGKCNADKIWVEYVEGYSKTTSKLSYFISEGYSEDKLENGIVGYSFESGLQPIIEVSAPKSCKCGCNLLFQDRDVFDTWFSSGQWPFATLKATGDFDKFYPTAVMETGWDILFFWVARMIMLGLYETGEVPFKHVYLHGLVRDKDRQKMSKSKGNVIDPLGVSEQYGSDAVRLALVFGVSAGNDVVISEEKIRGMRNFTNKIWNASRFVAFSVSEGDFMTGELGDKKIADLNIDETILTKADQDLLDRHFEVTALTTQAINEFRFQIAGELLYEYVWHTFCDQYIEAAKSQLGPGVIPSKAEGSPANAGPIVMGDSSLPQNDTKENTKKILIKILTESLVMLHPFIPYVTEAVWQELRELYPALNKSIMTTSWPKT